MTSPAHEITSYLWETSGTISEFLQYNPELDPFEMESLFISLRKDGYINQNGEIWYLTDIGKIRYPKKLKVTESMMRFRKIRCPRCRKMRKFLRQSYRFKYSKIGVWGPIEGWENVCSFCIEGKSNDRSK